MTLHSAAQLTLAAAAVSITSVSRRLPRDSSRTLAVAVPNMKVAPSMLMGYDLTLNPQAAAR